MALNKATVAHIARLARIRVPEEDMDRLAEELSHILGWIEQLDEVDTEGTAPLSSVVEMALKMREDRVTDGGYPHDVLANAPERTDGFYTVQKVVE
ncbi:MAG: Asp-tRNA(Asn)/Glu-tRNA(Gln) amidotransferase subunit GatC [Alphaproteobacteria bacterium]